MALPVHVDVGRIAGMTFDKYVITGVSIAVLGYVIAIGTIIAREIMR